MPKPLSTNPITLSAASALHWLNMLRQLSRTELSVMVSLSALTGQVFAAKQLSPAAILVSMAVFLLAIGCSALNQWQEQDLDGRMERTRRRPLPSGKLSANHVLIFAGCCIGCGLLLLSLLPGALALLLGLLSVIWYNGIYTPLKRYTPFAALPGAICGALPPMIGWTSSGAPIMATEILILSGTLFLWQIPHSWLLLCHYRQDLQRSGLPNLFQKIPTSRLLQINNCWLASLMLCYLLFPVFNLLSNQPLTVLYVIGLGAISCAYLYVLREKNSAITPLRIFHLVNLSMTMLLLTLIIDNLV